MFNNTMFNPYAGLSQLSSPQTSNRFAALLQQPMPTYGGNYNAGVSRGDMIRANAMGYDPQMNMQNRFASLLDSMPQREKAPWWKKLLAGGLGTVSHLTGGPEIGMQAFDNTLNKGYNEKYADWKTQTALAQQAADNERQANQVGYSAWNQQEMRRQADEKLNEQERAARERESLAQTKEARQAKLDEAKIFKMQNPDAQFRVVDGKLYALHPQTGEAVFTGVEGLSRMEELQFTANAAMDRVMAQQEGANTRTGMTIAGADKRNQDTIAGANERAQLGGTPFNQVNPDGSTSSVFVNRQGQASPITGVSGTLQRPAAPPRAGIFNEAQQRQIYRTRAEQFKNQSQLGKWVTVQPNGQVVITPVNESTSWTGAAKGPTKAEWDQINTAIYGGTGLNINKPPANTTPTNTAPAGKVLMTDPNGRQGYVPATQVEAAIAQGYKRN